MSLVPHAVKLLAICALGCTQARAPEPVVSPPSASAGFAVPTVTPVPGTVSYADEATTKELLPKSIVKQGDLVLGKTTIAGPCYDPARHAALLVGLVDDEGKPTAPMRDLALDLDGDGKKDAVIEIDVAARYRYALYVKRGSCGYFVGDVEVDGTLERTEEKANGLAVLVAEVVCKKKPCSGGSQKVAFDGKTYAVTP